MSTRRRPRLKRVTTIRKSKMTSITTANTNHYRNPFNEITRLSNHPLAQALFVTYLIFTLNYCTAHGAATSPQDVNPAFSIISNVVSSGSLALPTANGTAPLSNQFYIKVIHNDSKSNLSYVNIMPVNYPNHNEPRIDLRYTSKYPYVSLDERAPNNTVVAVVVVDDPDNGPSGEVSLSIEHGNELNHFRLVSTGYSNTIQVNGAPLSKHRVPEYNLLIVARDHGIPPRSSNITLVIKLTTSTHQLATNAPLEPQPNLKPPVTDLMYVGAMLVVIFSALIFLIIIGCALVQRPKSKKGPPPRATSATNSRIHPSTDHCFCLGLSNL